MKILITADIHINDYRNYNLFEDAQFRLKQFDRLSDRLIEIYQEENCEAIIIAGDLLNVASPRPYVVNEVYKFLKKINDISDNVLICHGQHDLDTRREITINDTLLSIFNSLENVEYLHREFTTLENRIFYFYGWEPKFILPEEIKGDVLIGHHTVPNVKIGQSEVIFKGNEDIHAKGFKIAFFGDIHRHQKKGNIVIPGTPIQNSFSDHPDTGVVILDLKNLDWYRVQTETEKNRFLKFLITDEEIKDEWIITSPLTKKKTESVEIIKEKTLQIKDYINSGVTRMNLGDIHKLMESRVSTKNTRELNIDFSINNISIKNFRSIDDLDIDLVPGTKLIVGKNGSGKSSLLEAISFGLTGEGNARSFVQIGQKEMEVKLEISYENNSYQIERGWKENNGWIKYFINQIEQKAENQTEMKNKIFQDLEFLELTDVFIHKQDRVGFLSSYSYKNRVDLMNRILGLEIVENLYNFANLSLSDLEEKIETLEKSRIYYQIILEQNKNIDFYPLTINYDQKIEDLKKVKNEYTKMIFLVEKIKGMREVIKQTETLLSQQAEVKYVPKEIFEKKILELRILEKSTKENLEKEVKLVNNHNSRKTSVEIEILNIEKYIKQTKEELEKLKKNICYACGQQISSSTEKLMIKKHLENIEEKTISIKNLKIEKDEIIKIIENSKIEKLKTLVMEAVKRLTEAENEKKNNDKLISLVLSQRKMKENHDKLIEDLNDEFKQERTFIDLFDNSHGTKFSISETYKEELKEIFESIISDISGLNTQKENNKQLLKLQEEIGKAKYNLNGINESLDIVEKEKEEIKSYVELMSPKGSIMASFLSDVSSLISTDTVRMKSYKKLVGGELKPDLTADMKVKENWIPYDILSGGQRTVVDLTVINKLLQLTKETTGLMMFDETFKFLDSENTEMVVDQLKDLRCRSIFIVSHLDSFPFYDQLVQVQLDERGNSLFSG